MRYLLPQLHAMNFVLDEVLDGGVNDALNLDSHGKALSFLLLELPWSCRRRSPRCCADPNAEHPLHTPEPSSNCLESQPK